DRTLLGNQVAHVPIRGQDGEVLAEVFVDRLGLGRRFDDEQVLGHVGSFWGRGRPGGARVAQKATLVKRRRGIWTCRRPGRGPGVQLSTLLVESRRRRCCQASPGPMSAETPDGQANGAKDHDAENSY